MQSRKQVHDCFNTANLRKISAASTRRQAEDWIELVCFINTRLKNCSSTSNRRKKMNKNRGFFQQKEKKQLIQKFNLTCMVSVQIP